MLYKMIYLARRNPEVSPQDFPRAWRSHAAYVSSTFTMAVKPIARVDYCVRMYDPQLDGMRYDPPAASRDYDGVAIAASPAADAFKGVMPGFTLEDWCAETGLTPADRALIDADERRVFDAQVPTFGFRAIETVTRGGKPGMHVVVRLLSRRDGATRDQFAARYNGEHAALAGPIAERGATRYIQNVLREEPPPGYPFDGVSETWFASAEDALRAFGNPDFARVEADLAQFCDLSRSVTLACDVRHRWPREQVAA